VNRAAEVIGINTAIIPSAHGIGFAIPINTVRAVLRDLVASRPIVRPTLGVLAVSVSPQVAFANGLETERGCAVFMSITPNYGAGVPVKLWTSRSSVMVRGRQYGQSSVAIGDASAPHCRRHPKG
jgi:hypothetical protein